MQDDSSTPLDLQLLDDLFEVAPSGFREFVRLFLKITPSKIAAIRSAAASGDADALQRTAHSLKGSAANIGARHLSRLCYQLERLAFQGRAQEALPLVEQLGDEYDRARHALELQALERQAPSEAP